MLYRIQVVVGFALYLGNYVVQDSGVGGFVLYLGNYVV